MATCDETSEFATNTVPPAWAFDAQLEDIDEHDTIKVQLI